MWTHGEEVSLALLGGEGQSGKGGVHLNSVKQDSVSITSSVKLKLSERIFNHKQALKYTTKFFLLCWVLIPYKLGSGFMYKCGF